MPSQALPRSAPEKPSAKLSRLEETTIGGRRRSRRIAERSKREQEQRQASESGSRCARRQRERDNTSRLEPDSATEYSTSSSMGDKKDTGVKPKSRKKRTPRRRKNMLATEGMETPPLPILSSTAPLTPPLLRYSNPTESILQEELEFMARHLKELEEAMSRLTEYRYLEPKLPAEEERIRQEPRTSSEGVDVTPGSTVFYSDHSTEFFQFCRLWHFANAHYMMMSTDENVPTRTYKFDKTVPAGIDDVDLASQVDIASLNPHVDFSSLGKIKQSWLMAETLEQAAFVAEQKVREVYGVFKLISTEKCSTKMEAALLMQDTGAYPAHRILAWVNEFLESNGSFSRF